MFVRVAGSVFRKICIEKRGLKMKGFSLFAALHEILWAEENHEVMILL